MPPNPPLPSTTVVPDEVAEASERLWRAHESGVACRPVRDLIGDQDLAAAYGVQSRITELRLASGSRVVGRKIGLTSKLVQDQLGVDQPDFGVLFDDMAYSHSDEIPMSRLMQPRIEAELAFVLQDDLDEGPFDVARVRSAVAYAVAALEVVDSRVAGWDISLGDTVADNASSGVFVLGSQRLSLDELEPADVDMTMIADGEIVSTGDGRACMGDPLNALAWLANVGLDLGMPLRAGQVVLSGAMGPMHPVRAGMSVVAELSGLGEVAVRFSQVEAYRGAK